MLNQGALVLEGVTLGGVVQLMVEVLVDLSRGTVLDQETAEYSLTTHPDDLPVNRCVNLVQPLVSDTLSPSISQVCRARARVKSMAQHLQTFPNPITGSLGDGSNVLRHTGISGTLPLSETTVATDPAGEVQLTSTGTRVHGDWLADDEAIGDELANGLAGVGARDLVDLVGVEPNLALAAAEDISREAFLSSQVDPIMQKADSQHSTFSWLVRC